MFNHYSQCISRNFTAYLRGLVRNHSNDRFSRKRPLHTDPTRMLKPVNNGAFLAKFGEIMHLDAGIDP
jgi:hypothetical protein